MRPVLLLALATAFAGPGPGHVVQTGGSSQTAGGLHRFVLTTPHGSITVSLPADASAGSRISGSLIRAADGATPDAIAANLARLERYQVTLPGLTGAPLADRFVLEIPAGAEKQQIQVQVESDTPSRDKLPWFVPMPPMSVQGHQEIRPPTTGQVGRPIQVPGSFDGDASNTRVTVNGTPVRILAESPSQMVFESPLQPTGPARLVVQEGQQTRSSAYRNVQVDLSAAKTHLTRGETTQLRLDVTGLQGLERDLPVRLVTSGAAAAEGGNTQRFIIKPGDVGSDGGFHVERSLTGTRTGDFDVTGGVVMPLMCNLQGQTVHVEGSPSGSESLGKWWVFVKFPGKDPFKLWLDSPEKPALQKCNWIQIGACAADDDGDPIATGWTKVADPTRRPPTKAVPPLPPAPKPVPVGGDSFPPDPIPCKEGEERNPSDKVSGSFEVLAAWSKPTATFSWDAAGGRSAAIGLADFFEKGAKVGDKVGDKLPDTPATGPAKLLLKYLEGGAMILKGVADSKIAYRASTVTFSLTIETITYTASKWTVEVCRKGKWVKEVRCSKGTAAGSVFTDHVTITNKDRDWEKISDSSNEAYLDPAKLNEFFTAWVKERLEKLAGNADKYADFIKDCPK